MFSQQFSTTTTPKLSCAVCGEALQCHGACISPISAVSLKCSLHILPPVGGHWHICVSYAVNVVLLWYGTWALSWVYGSSLESGLDLGYVQGWDT